MIAPQVRHTLGPDTHVLTISHRHGVDTILYADHEDATSALADYARRWWNEITSSQTEGDRKIPQSVGGLDDDTVISIYFDHQGGESYGIYPVTTTRPTAPRFELDDAKARAFLHRALRRYDGTLSDNEGEGASGDENWTLTPGWDINSIFSDELSHIEDLVHQAIHVVGAITFTADLPAAPEDVALEPLIEAPQDGRWNYLWRVSLPISSSFALCSPSREEIHRLGWTDDDIKAKGCRAAMGILREAVAIGNQILAAYTEAGGRIPAGTA
ncbi:hypothetical protein AB0C84_42845 [Actinomadura sp. NPDC048955]|uniref:hypothetical protein n=1 Tax=Actinomadura sp. NPDC048955 TaxID=3158228 RepID=UPI0033D44E8B